MNSPTKVNTKKVYYLLNHSKKDDSDILPPKANGNTFAGEVEEASVLNQHFHFIFIHKPPSTMNVLALMTGLHDFMPNKHVHQMNDF